MSPAPVLLMSAGQTPGENQWAEPSDRPSWQGTGSRGRVLVVDDDVAVRMLVSRILQEAGYEVETATDGIGALQSLASARHDFDLVVTDVRMPAMDGWELGRRIHRDHPMLPVLYVSGYDLAKSAPSALTFLRKPFEAPELLGRISHLLGEA